MCSDLKHSVHYQWVRIMFPVGIELTFKGLGNPAFPSQSSGVAE